VTSFFYVVFIAFHTSVPALRKCTHTSRKKILTAESAATRAPPVAPLRHLMPFMKSTGHSYTCCSDRHASPYWTFIRRWISMGFSPPPLKKRMTERCSSLVHVARGVAIFTLLLRRRVAFLHRTATCQPLFNPRITLLSTYETIEMCFEILSHI